MVVLLLYLKQKPSLKSRNYTSHFAIMFNSRLIALWSVSVTLRMEFNILGTFGGCGSDSPSGPDVYLSLSNIVSYARYFYQALCFKNFLCHV